MASVAFVAFVEFMQTFKSVEKEKCFVKVRHVYGEGFPPIICCQRTKRHDLFETELMCLTANDRKHNLYNILKIPIVENQNRIVLCF